MMEFESELLERMRKLKAKMSYEAMGRLFGVSAQTVRRWLTGKTGISIGFETLIRLKLQGK